MREGWWREGLDITDPGRVREVAAECGDVALLVNNAGVMKPGTFTGHLTWTAPGSRWRLTSSAR